MLIFTPTRNNRAIVMKANDRPCFSAVHRNPGVDYTEGTLSYFVDGALICKHHASVKSDLHDGPGTWTLGKRQPDDWKLKAVSMQRVLMYDRSLTDKDIFSLGNEDGLRTCSKPGEKDADKLIIDNFVWKDRFSHGCEWYKDHATANEGMCSTNVRRQCPIACAVAFYCATPPLKMTNVFKRPLVLTDYRVCLVSNGSYSTLDEQIANYTTDCNALSKYQRGNILRAGVGNDLGCISYTNARVLRVETNVHSAP